MDIMWNDFAWTGFVVVVVEDVRVGVSIRYDS